MFRLRNEIESINEDDLDEVEREYNRLAPEYNRLIDYLNSVSQKFSLIQQQFTEEQVRFFSNKSFSHSFLIESRKSKENR